jgi:hypothetical protein
VRPRFDLQHYEQEKKKLKSKVSLKTKSDPWKFKKKDELQTFVKNMGRTWNY